MMNLQWNLDELLGFSSRLTRNGLNQYIQQTAVKIMDGVKQVLIGNTPVLTGELKSKWGSAKYKIEKKKDSVTVQLTNPKQQGYWANYGHYSYNGQGGPYVVRNRTPKVAEKLGHNFQNTFVFGHFFLQFSLMQVQDSGFVENQLKQMTNKWFRWCVHGT